MRKLQDQPTSIRFFRDQHTSIEQLRLLTGASLNDLFRQAVDLGIRRLRARAELARSRRRTTKRRRKVVA